jgi:putative acetyltransferase
MDETPPITIRDARPTDAEVIAAMQALPGLRYGTLRLPHPSPADIRRYLEAPVDGNPRLVALAGDTVVGMADLHRYTGRRAHAAGLGIGVHDAWTGRGVGHALMAELVDYGERWLGLRRIELTVHTDNACAIALYRRFNFTVEGTLRGHSLRDGAYVDAYAMARMAA